MKNKVVHTGANIQLGGLNQGFLRVAYQVGIEEKVKTDPSNPAISQTRIEKISLVRFCFFIKYI